MLVDLHDELLGEGGQAEDGEGLLPPENMSVDCHSLAGEDGVVLTGADVRHVLVGMDGEELGGWDCYVVKRKSIGVSRKHLMVWLTSCCKSAAFRGERGETYFF